MKYGIIDTASLTKRPGNGYCGHTPHDDTLAVSMGLPGVERNGLPRKRDSVGFAAPLAALYTAYGLEWAVNGLKPRNDKALGYDNGTNKHNHQTGLVAAGLITVLGTQKSGGEYVMLTDAGVERCKAVSPELGKLAKGFTMAAYDKATKAAAKAARNAKADAQATADGVYNAAGAFDGDLATQVAGTPDNSTSEAPTGFEGGDGSEPITADQVEAAAQAEYEASTERLSDHE